MSKFAIKGSLRRLHGELLKPGFEATQSIGAAVKS